MVLDDLYALVYVSEAVSPFTEAELDTLLEVSRAYNRRLGVTGFLAYEDPVAEERPGTFVQRIEGPRDAVRDAAAAASRYRSLCRSGTWRSAAPCTSPTNANDARSTNPVPPSAAPTNGSSATGDAAA